MPSRAPTEREKLITGLEQVEAALLAAQAKLPAMIRDVRTTIDAAKAVPPPEPEQPTLDGGNSDAAS